MDKQSVLSTFNGLLFGNKRKEILTHVTAWTNLDDTMRIKRIQQNIIWPH
jgi:hypothetical protein